jgi:transposase InsO family protein
MDIRMNHQHPATVAALAAYMEASKDLHMEALNRPSAYTWIAATLLHYRYPKLSKTHRGLVTRYICHLTGYSPAQAKRLIAQWMAHGRIRVVPYKRSIFAKRYTLEDIALLATVDNAHDRLSGPATKKILEREYTVWHNEAYVRLQHISVGHIYNLRHTDRYRQHSHLFTHTSGPKVTLGKRAKPVPDGKPGYIRVDSVHQGDAPDGTKGVYLINFVDEVTQWELVACVPRISERYMRPMLAELLAQFPFVVIEFHADNGSEYINHVVVDLLQRLHIHLSKSRPRRHNDNALVETKNGSIIRKHLGYSHIPAVCAPLVNAWCQQWLNPYLNYHRPCAFATTTISAKGKQTKHYRLDDYHTPFDKLQSFDNARQYLKPNISFESLGHLLYTLSDTAWATELQIHKDRMFAAIHEQVKRTKQT